MINTEKVTSGKVFFNNRIRKNLLDFTGGWTKHSTLGHRDPGVINAINSQLEKYAHIDGNIWILIFRAC